RCPRAPREGLVVEVKAAFSKLKGSRNTPLFFFFCESGEDGKPVLLLDNKKIPPKESNAVLATAKKKGKCSGTLAINDDAELVVPAAGSALSSLSRGLQVAARNANAMVFNGIVIGASEAKEEEDTDAEGGEVPPAPPLPSSSGGKPPKAPPPPKVS